jgi:hypothetical protein
LFGKNTITSPEVSLKDTNLPSNFTIDTNLPLTLLK